ncbi:ArnT family glycosyltransferase [Chromobacterium paludis]|uniref:UDP phosphate-alpha-4-amino-4-deoxy-L-arabinose arabinosyl transferase n=1 Tax=Chromobacterium paludis TaxID=2605945 RepID=A0A5C1DL15_9NEIS|nr:UDP phosphate-alpha-4-amino-4-deoxy-L- arabinose arabinosyl transferase [Chromobacterium paludis]QEL56689.1 UDP phosphate-alpha-4-amino-4-deoxy-L- arabinose arabinosyl transferase [Chromobacterium paludis]
MRPAPAPGWLATALLLALWLLPGLVGHEPWKPDEAYTFGLVRHLAASGDWTVPALAGEPFLEKPPLFFITASWTMTLFQGWLGAPDSARLAAGLWNLIAWLGLAIAARGLFGPGHGRWAPLLLIGAIGLPVRAHQLITDTALMAGFCWGLAGLCHAAARPVRGGLMLGAGAAIAFLSKGLLGPACIGLAALALLWRHAYRTRAYLAALAIALLVALPLPLLWMGALYARSPDSFHVWLCDNNFGRFNGTSNLGPRARRWFYGRTLPWYALPLWPLALWTLWRLLRRPQAGMPLSPPLALFACTLLVLTSAADARELYALPLLPPLTLLALAALSSGWQPPRWLNVGLATLFALLLAYLLLVACALSFAMDAAWRHQLLQGQFSGWQATFFPRRWLAFGLALLALAWCWRQGPPGLPRLLWRWSVATTLLWCGAAMLWLPALDHGMRYRETFAALRPRLEAIRRDGGCVASQSLGEPQRALLEYYTGYRTLRLETQPAARSCHWLLLQTLREQIPPRLAGLHPIYTFQRPGDHKERFLLYFLP